MLSDANASNAEQENKRNLQSSSETEKYRCVCVLTDKTNFTRVINIEYYRRWVSDKILKVVNLTLHLKVVALFEDAKKILDKVKMELSVQDVFCEASTSDASNPVSKTTD